MSPLLEEKEPSTGFQSSETLLVTSDGGGICDEHSHTLTLSRKYSELDDTKDTCLIEPIILVFQITLRELKSQYFLIYRLNNPHGNTFSLLWGNINNDR